MQETFTSPVPASNLFGGSTQPIVSGGETITGGKYVRGTVLGRITTGGKLTKVDSSKSTGEQIAVAVLAEDVDASAVDAVGAVYYTGEFNTRALVFGGTDTAATHKHAAAARGLFFKDTVAA